MQKTKFFHYLDMFQVVALGFSFMLADQIYYFNISRPAKFMLSFFKLSSRVKEFKFGLHEVKHESGESYIPKAIENDLIGICNDIENKILRKNSFIREFGSFFDAEKIIMYFRKMCCRKIEGVIILMSVIVWYRRKSQKDQVVPVEFYVEKSPFYSVLKEFALSEYGITVRPLLPFKTIADHFYLVIGNVYILMRASVKPIIRALKKKKKSGHQSENSATPMIANLYTLNGFTFDLTKRCDFPWLLTADIPGGQLLTFFERADVPVTGEMVDAMRKRGIRNMARLKSEKFTSELPIYEVTLIYCRTAFKYMTKTIALVLKELAKLRPTSFVYLGWAMRFIRTYSLEYDFYITNNIII
ncbi:MAG: hypothetical protein KKB81_00880, partial [Candidatus Margulisbacteria bacterium]|nr:hypothetical protein [Candidatus Margulisiibacteriota bacterium]